jgi:hypothetical protein
MATYISVKKAVIDLVDDFTEADVADNYVPQGKAIYNAKTKLVKLYITEPVLAIMPIRFNKAMKKVSGKSWTDVGSLDLVDKKTIGELILLACGNSGTKVPVGEPT